MKIHDSIRGFVFQAEGDPAMLQETLRSLRTTIAEAFGLGATPDPATTAAAATPATAERAPDVQGREPDDQ